MITFGSGVKENKVCISSSDKLLRVDDVDMIRNILTATSMCVHDKASPS